MEKKLYVFDFDGTLTTRNITAVGVGKGMIDFKLSQCGFDESGPLLKECIQAIQHKGHFAAIASYGDASIISKDKLGGYHTIRYALDKYEVETDDTFFVSLECFMPCQLFIRKWKEENPGKEPGSQQADEAEIFEQQSGKNIHIANILCSIQTKYDVTVPPENIILYDDDANNRKLASEKGYQTVEVYGADGFSFLSDIIASLK